MTPSIPVNKCLIYITYILGSKELPLTVSCLSPLSGFKSRSESKLPVTWDWTVFFADYSVFLQCLQLATYDLTVTW